MFAINDDLHVHSSYSDGNAGISEIAQRANLLHLDTIAITDHFWPSLGSQRGGKSIIENRRLEINTAKKEYPKLTILDGAEVDASWQLSIRVVEERSLSPAGSLDQAIEVASEVGSDFFWLHRWSLLGTRSRTTFSLPLAGPF